MFSQSCFFHEFLYIYFLFLFPMCTLNPPPSLVISFLEICPESRKFSVPLPVPHLVQAMTISGLDCCIIVLMIFFFLFHQQIHSLYFFALLCALNGWSQWSVPPHCLADWFSLYSVNGGPPAEDQ